jgi:hypothetical protein
MTLFEKLFLTGYFLAIIFVQAKWQAVLFKRNLPISHKWHALYYCLTILPMVYFFSAFWWQVVLIGILCRLAFFDGILNAIRGKPVFGYNGRGTTSSWLDRLENALSETWVKVLKVLYVAIFITVLILI